ncbi:Solute carrier family 25 member 51 [Orchesella cincta]|uniref:Solute carrier family 25 member 51 n=1 Tax=Orchesella cincta TaxID=48709 RepID=A0A1D2M2Z6_ORCCI|nr:Solute carrier family 25 member 51 [Orchesella cincta]
MSNSSNISNSERICACSTLKVEGLCGRVFVGLISITATYPLHKIMFRQMRDGLPLTVAVDQVRKRGLLYALRGVLSPLGMRAVSLSLMFGSYGSCRAFLQTNVHN